MGTDVDRAIERAGALIGRLSPQAQRLVARDRKRRRQLLLKKLGRVVIAGGLLLVGFALFGLLIQPLGATGVMLAAGLFILISALLLNFPRYPHADEAALAQVDIRALPAQTEIWMAAQRRALPAPATNAFDSIALKLETLGPQLQTIDPREPVAVEARKILSEHLTELVSGYQRVPEPLRRERQPSGKTPDEQLTDGLNLIDSELAEVSRNIAAGDLHKLATQDKFLELKYRGDDGLS